MDVDHRSEREGKKLDRRRKKHPAWLILIEVLFLPLLLVGVYFYVSAQKNPAIAPTESGTRGSVTETVGDFDSKESVTEDQQEHQPAAPDNTTDNTNIDEKEDGVEPSADPYRLYEEGVAASKAGQHEEAIKLYDQAISISPSIPEFYSKKAESQVQLGRKSDAINTIQAGLRQSPEDATLKNKLEILQIVVN